VNIVEVHIKKIPLNASKDTCIASEYIFDSLGLSKKVMHSLHFGQLSKPVYFVSQKGQDESLFVPESIFNELLLMENITSNIWKKDKDIYLGPVVGIFETPRVLNKIIAGNPRDDDMQHIHASIAENCFSYFFSTDNIDWTNRKIKGFTYSLSLGKWEHDWFPFPSVFYDEGVFYAKGIKPLVKEIRTSFRSDPNIHVINSRNSLSKWKLCAKLSKYPEVKRYIPETIIYTKFDDVLLMLKKYNFIFLKSFNGSKGHEVLSIEFKNNLYILNFFNPKLNTVQELDLNDLNHMKEFVYKYTNADKFVIQQGIRLIKFNGHNMDLRVMIMKDEDGRWQSIFKSCRVAKGKSTITNGAAGGESVLFSDVYPSLSTGYSNIQVPTGNQIDEISIKIAAYIEKAFGSFGELGLDIAIDISGRLWILEANAKPDKVLEKKFISIDGGIFIEQLFKEQQKNNNYPLKRMPNGEGILLQAVTTFKYAKFLANCK
jgi:hypothetical protein